MHGECADEARAIGAIRVGERLDATQPDAVRPLSVCLSACLSLTCEPSSTGEGTPSHAHKEKREE